MSKLYVVVQLNFEKRFNYKYRELHTTCQPCIPYIFDSYEIANKAAEQKRKAHVTAFVVEFPFNPLDERLENLEAKVKANAEYIMDLEHEIGKLERELQLKEPSE